MNKEEQLKELLQGILAELERAVEGAQTTSRRSAIKRLYRLLDEL